MNNILDNNTNLPVAYEISRSEQPYITVIPVMINDNDSYEHDDDNNNIRFLYIKNTRNIIINNIRIIILIIMIIMFIYILSMMT